MTVYSILVCNSTFTISRLGCEFLVTVFLYYILIHQSQAGSCQFLGAFIYSYVGCVHKHRFWLWSRKIPPECTVQWVFYRENTHREYITRRGKIHIALHIWAESFWIILNQNRFVYTTHIYEST